MSRSRRLRRAFELPSEAFIPRAADGLYFVDHFVSALSLLTTSGSGAAALTSVDRRPGAVGLEVSTIPGVASISGGATLSLGDGAMTVAWGLFVDTLGTVAEDYSIRVGLGDRTGSGQFDKGIYFELDRATFGNSIWRAVTAVGGTRTKVSTGVVCTEGDWTDLEFIVAGGGDAVAFSIDGQRVATINTNLPNEPDDPLQYVCQLVKTAGTDTRVVYADYVELIKETE